MLIEQAWQFPQKSGANSPPPGIGALALSASQRQYVLHSPLQVFLAPLYELWMKDLDDHYVTLAVIRFQSRRVRYFLIACVVNGKDRYQYADYLASLLAGDKPPARLLKALSSPSAEIRLAAAHSLYQCGSIDLVPHIQALVKDNDSKVRIAGAIVALGLSTTDWHVVRPAVLSLLSDVDVEVRGQVAGLTVDRGREGKNLAPNLLRLIQDNSLSQLAHIYVYNAMVKIGGSDFGYEEDFRRDYWRPTTPANRAAIERFSDWVTRNVRDAKPEPQ